MIRRAVAGPAVQRLPGRTVSVCYWPVAAIHRPGQRSQVFEFRIPSTADTLAERSKGTANEPLRTLSPGPNRTQRSEVPYSGSCREARLVHSPDDQPKHQRALAYQRRYDDQDRDNAAKSAVRAEDDRAETID
jgi:hypothetical protein